MVWRLRKTVVFDKNLVKIFVFEPIAAAQLDSELEMENLGKRKDELGFS